jgi:hypothetical protein
MHIEFLVEEQSAETALQILIPRIIGPDVGFRIHSHEGKQDLLKKLPDRLRGYRAWLPDDWRIVILIDEDRQDCRALKERLEGAAAAAGLTTKSKPGPRGRFQVVNRLAIEELEAWFFGDVPALTEAYPGVPPTLGRRRGHRDPDSIAGGTWESLERILKRAGHCRAGMVKMETARRVSTFMDPDRNTSRSFRIFRDSLRQVAVG